MLNTTAYNQIQPCNYLLRLKQNYSHLSSHWCSRSTWRWTCYNDYCAHSGRTTRGWHWTYLRSRLVPVSKPSYRIHLINLVWNAIDLWWLWNVWKQQYNLSSVARRVCWVVYRGKRNIFTFKSARKIQWGDSAESRSRRSLVSEEKIKPLGKRVWLLRLRKNHILPHFLNSTTFSSKDITGGP